MGALGDLFGSILKPLLLALLIIIALGLFSNRPGTAGSGAASFSCPNWFTDPEINRLVCRYHPVRIWNTPVADLLPWLEAFADPTDQLR